MKRNFTWEARGLEQPSQESGNLKIPQADSQRNTYWWGCSGAAMASCLSAEQLPAGGTDICRCDTEL